MRHQKPFRIIFFVLISIFIFQSFIACVHSVADESQSATSQSCLLYYSHVEEKEGIYRFCPENGTNLIIQSKDLIDYSVSFINESIFYSELNEQNEGNIKKFDFNKNEVIDLYHCGNSLCENIIAHPFEDVVIFSTRGENARIVIYDVVEKAETIIEYGLINFIDLSPDGKYIRYAISGENILRIFDLENMQLQSSWNVASDLIGGWSQDGSAFLVGARDVDGQLRKNTLNEINIGKLTETVLFELPLDVDISQSLYLSENSYLALVRSGVKINSRQLSEIDRNGDIKFELTNDPTYNHSSIAWNRKNNQLAFQRYNVTSSKSVPEIWIWDQSINAFQLIAENASNPIWQTN